MAKKLVNAGSQETCFGLDLRHFADKSTSRHVLEPGCGVGLLISGHTGDGPDQSGNVAAVTCQVEGGDVLSGFGKLQKELRRIAPAVALGKTSRRTIFGNNKKRAKRASLT
jgi:hypothetical protein